MPQSPTSVAAPTLGEVESSLRELDAAIIGHTKWLTEWNTRIICGIPVEDRYIAEGSHRESYFGRWYYAEHARFLHQHPSFVAIGERHRRVHNGMSTIAKKVNGGTPPALSIYRAFIDAEVSLSESVIALRDELYRLLLSFDYLTGALNRQAFFHLLELEYSRVIRLNEPGCVVFLDIDNFKQINDRYGHAAGDAALAAVASFVMGNMRLYDSVCRYGGEEFLICMPQTTSATAYAIIDRIREALSQKRIAIADNHEIQISASFGIATMSAAEALTDTLEHADNALYRAKADGRNRVGIWKPLP
ncbi:MAG: diguanylate cyclase [Gammaproteobacteria bacterium]|nr:diguanylate cyclase [Gammaproteobacteria bacterium]